MQETITITLEEYKELLIIKGKYEELKEKQSSQALPNTILLKETKEEIPKYPYKVTCELKESE